MVTLDQVLLLQEKVESAVKKIAQLEVENETLNAKCSELEKSFSEKTELISSLETALSEKESEFQKSLSEKDERISSLEADLASLETDQGKIEAGILQALNKLDAIENSVLKAGEEAAGKKAAHEKGAKKDNEKEAGKDGENEPEKDGEKDPQKASGLAQQAEEVNKSDEGNQFDIF